MSKSPSMSFRLAYELHNNAWIFDKGTVSTVPQRVFLLSFTCYFDVFRRLQQIAFSDFNYGQWKNSKQNGWLLCRRKNILFSSCKQFMLIYLLLCTSLSLKKNWNTKWTTASVKQQNSFGYKSHSQMYRVFRHDHLCALFHQSMSKINLLLLLWRKSSVTSL